MAIVSNISVGDILFYEVDDIPTHSAPKGSISILNGSNFNNSVFYINNDGGTTWLKIVSPSYGYLYLNNNTVGVSADGDQTLGAWYSFSDQTQVLGTSYGFTKGTDATFGDYLEYTGSTLTRMLLTNQSTMRAGPTKWISWETGGAINFTIPPNGFNECFGPDNAGTINCGSTRILEGNTGDHFEGAISPISRESGGGTASRIYIPRHTQVVAVKVDEALEITVLDEGFESSGFTENSWSVVNDTENIWVVGQAESNGGTSSAYVSNDGGTSATYNINNAEVSHFYKDFTFDSNLQSVSLSFDWKCQGENAAGATQYDYGAVVITSTATTPTAGSEVSTTQATGGGDGRIGADDNLGKFNLNYGTTPGTTWNTEIIDLSDYIGQTKRIVFTWNNDGSVGADPPFIVDNIKITEYYW
jgi:hypothetical protein